MSLSFAIIGCGNIGNRHADLVPSAGNLVAVCDIVKERAGSLAKKYDAEAFFDIGSLFDSGKKIDVVVVCTPNALHAPHSITALKANCHVLCEKPMAISSVDCLEMIAAAGQAGKYLIVVKQNRFNPPVTTIKKILDENRLGKIFSFQLSCFWNRNSGYYKDSWKGTLALDGGTLFTQFSHFIDLLYWFFGDVKEVKAFGKNYAHKNIIEFEDTGVAILLFENGITGTINYTVNSYGRNMEGSLSIFGAKGTVKIGGQYLNELEYQNIEGYKIENLPAGNRANDYGHYQGSMSNHDKVYQNLVDVINNRAPMAAGGTDGLKTVQIIEKIYEDAEFLN